MKRIEELKVAYEQLKQQNEWALAHGYKDLAAAYYQGLRFLSSKILDAAMETSNAN